MDSGREDASEALSARKLRVWLPRKLRMASAEPHGCKPRSTTGRPRVAIREETGEAWQELLTWAWAVPFLHAFAGRDCDFDGRATEMRDFLARIASSQLPCRDVPAGARSWHALDRHGGA